MPCVSFCFSMCGRARRLPQWDQWWQPGPWPQEGWLPCSNIWCLVSIFSSQKKNLAERQLREREWEKKKKITAQLINSSTLFFLFFHFSLPAAPRCIVLLARAATEYYIWPLCMQQPEGSPIKSPTITMHAEPANATHMSLLGKSGFSKKKKKKSRI